MEQQLSLLLAVVEHVQTAVEDCTSNLGWVQQAQQLQEKLQALRAAVVSAEAGAGRSLLPLHTLLLLLHSSCFSVGLFCFPHGDGGCGPECMLCCRFCNKSIVPAIGCPLEWSSTGPAFKV